MRYKNNNLSGLIMPAMVFLLLWRFGSSLQYDTLSTIGVIHHNETGNAPERISVLVFEEHTTLCVWLLLLSLRHDGVWEELISFAL